LDDAEFVIVIASPFAGSNYTHSLSLNNYTTSLDFNTSNEACDFYCLKSQCCTPPSLSLSSSPPHSSHSSQSCGCATTGLPLTPGAGVERATPAMHDAQCDGLPYLFASLDAPNGHSGVEVHYCFSNSSADGEPLSYVARLLVAANSTSSATLADAHTPTGRALRLFAPHLARTPAHYFDADGDGMVSIVASYYFSVFNVGPPPANTFDIPAYCKCATAH
jgi:hypothetical protein